MLSNYTDTIINNDLIEYKKNSVSLSSNKKIEHLKFAIDVDSQKIVDYLVNFDSDVIQKLKDPLTVISELRNKSANVNMLEDLYYLYYLSLIINNHTLPIIKYVQLAESITQPTTISRDFLLNHADKIFDFSILFYSLLHFSNDSALNDIICQYTSQALKTNYNVCGKINHETLLHFALKRRLSYSKGFDSPIEKLIRLIIAINPDSLHVVDEAQKTPLSLVEGEYKGDLIRCQLIEISKTQTGNTLLHDIFESCASLNDFETKVQSIDPDERTLYALTVNNAGKLPCNIINPKLSQSEHQQIFARWISFASAQKVRPLHELISFSEIVDRYQLKPDTELYKRFKDACDIVNEVRIHIDNKEYLTHPEANGLSENDMVKMINKLKLRRKSKSYQLNRKLYRYATLKDVDETLNQKRNKTININLTPEKLIQLYFEDDKYNEIYNCEEMALYGYYLGKRKNLNIIPYHYINGDHVFDVIFEPERNPKDYNNWEEGDPIICDPWNALVCLGRESYKLGDYKGYIFQDKLFNFIITVNPKYQQIDKKNVCETKMVRHYSVDDIIARHPIFNNILPQLHTAKEIFLLLDIMSRFLEVAVSCKLITEQEINSWKDPWLQLNKYFTSDYHFLPLLHLLYANDETLFRKKLLAFAKHAEDLNQTLASGESAFFLAAKHGYDDVVAELLDKKVIQNRKVDGETALTAAIKQGHHKVIDLLTASQNNLAKGASLAQRNFFKETQTIINTTIESVDHKAIVLKC